MIKKRIQRLKKLIKNHKLDGYIIPKNDAYFSEFASPDRLKTISNFSGSAGFAIILKKENFILFLGMEKMKKLKMVTAYIIGIKRMYGKLSVNIGLARIKHQQNFLQK